MNDELPVDEFFEVLVKKLTKLLSRHFIYKQQESFLKNKKVVVKKDLPQIEKSVYFSDGYIAQYENCNLLHHYRDHALYAE